MRRLGFLLLCRLAGCAFVGCGDGGTIAPPIQVAQECAEGDLHVQVDAGQTSVPCAHWLSTLKYYRDLYTSRWGPVGLSEWTVQVVAHIDSDSLPAGLMYTGMTYFTSRVIQVTAATAIAHELFHVHLGSESSDHHNWSCEFGPWEYSVGLARTPDEGGYLPPCEGGAP